jgi:hypothetical protein
MKFPSTTTKAIFNFGGEEMDSGTIFVYILSAGVLGLIIYLAALSRRQRQQVVKPEDQKPRKAA